MSAFEQAWSYVLGNEGGYVDNPADPGGPTMYGVTEAVAIKWGYTGAMQDLPLATAQSIAKSEYWDPYQCDALDPRVAFEVFDAAYNGGKPALWLQEACNVSQDGDIGPQTIAAANAANPYVLCMRMTAYRIQYLTDLAGWTNFGKGWARRMASNLLQGAST